MRPLLFVLATMTGCTSTSLRVDAQALLGDDSVEVLHVEGGQGALALDAMALLVARDDALSIEDPTGELDATVDEATIVLPTTAALLSADQVLYGDGSALWVYEGFVQESPLAEVLTQVSGVHTFGGRLWLLDSGDAHRWSDDALTSLGLEGVTDLAVGGLVGGTEVVWLVDEAGAVALGARGLQGKDALTGAIDDVAVDGEGALWALMGDSVLRRAADGTELQWTLDQPIEAVLSHPRAPGAWLVTESHAVFAPSDPADARHAVELTGQALSVDDAGRLIELTEDGALQAWEPAYAAAWVGLLDDTRVEGEQSAWVYAPSATSVAVAAGETELTVAPDERTGWFEVSLDPVDLWGGVDVAATVSWEDGTRHTLRSLSLSGEAVGVVTWSEHIEPIASNHCGVCHDNSTETVLADAEDWQANIEAILEEVGAERMPLGSDALSDADQALIAAWAEGGFP